MTADPTAHNAAYVRATIVAPGVAGVVGDGVADDTAAIQALIDSTAQDGTVHFARPTGAGNDSCKVTAPLVVAEQGIRFDGAGREAYAVNLKMSSGSGPIIDVRAPGFVLDGVGLVGNGAAQGVGATVVGLDLYGDTSANIDCNISNASFLFLALGVRVRGRNATIRDSSFST